MAKRIKLKPKKSKKYIDPLAPKKPTCAYFFFQVIRRPQVKVEYPLLSNTEIVIQLGKDWNQLTDIQKLPFEKLAEADRIRYERDYEKYITENPEIGREEIDNNVESTKIKENTKEKRKYKKRVSKEKVDKKKKKGKKEGKGKKESKKEGKSRRKEKKEKIEKKEIVKGENENITLDMFFEKAGENLIEENKI